MHPLLNPDLGLIVWTAIAFVIVLFILGKYAWKPIMKSLDDREASIADSIATAERVRAEMAQLKNENEQLLAQAREERANLIKEAKLTRDKIIHEAKEQAKLDANKIIADAQVAIYNQKMSAITDVKNQVGALVLEISEKVLGRELSDKTAQEAFIKQRTASANLN